MTDFKNRSPYMELCDVCSQYRGFDYSIWKKPSNVRLPKSHR